MILCGAEVSLARWPKIVQALLIQLVALLLLAIGVTLLAKFVSPPYPDPGLVLAQAVLATLLSFRMNVWWRFIQFLLPVGLWAALVWEVNPWWGLVGFLLLWLVFRNAVVDRVPLYLTNNITRQALKELVKTRQDVRFIDLGCGLGANLGFMQALSNVEQADGVETAWASYAIAKLRTLFNGSRVWRQDLWQVDLKDYDLVYAFLSTEPMPKLWQKVCTEMKPGALFVSNSFPVPDVEPTEVWQLADRRQTELYIYQMPAESSTQAIKE